MNFHQLALLRLNVWRYSATKNKSKSSKSMYKIRTETLFCKLIVLFIISVTSWRLSLVKRGRVSVLSLCFYFIGNYVLKGLTTVMLSFRWQIYKIISKLSRFHGKKFQKPSKNQIVSGRNVIQNGGVVPIIQPITTKTMLPLLLSLYHIDT